MSKRRKYDGQTFVMYLGWYGLGRVFIEGLRTDSLYLMGTNLRISQLVAGLCVVFAVVFLFYNKVFKEHDPADLYVNQVAARAAAVEDNASQTEETAEVEETADAEETKESAEEPETLMEEGTETPIDETVMESVETEE
jgi:hypothetical protein